MRNQNEFLTSSARDMEFHNQDLLEATWREGVALLEQGQYQAAINCFEHIHVLLLAQGQVEEALPVMMKLIHLHHLLENWGMLQAYVQTVSDRLLNQQDDSRFLTGEELLVVAKLVPNVGTFEEGERIARSALRLCEEQGNLKSICDAWLCLFGLYNSTGRYDSADFYLRQIHHLVHRFDLGPLYQESLLSSSCQWHWYQGDLTRALRYNIQAIDLADANGLQKQQIRNRIVGGNIKQLLGKYSEAQSLYLVAEQLAGKSEFNRLVVDVHLQQTWLYILQERYDMARFSLRLAVQMSTSKQTLSIRIVQAVLYSLTGRTAEATELLQHSLEDCLQIGNLLLANTIRLHMAANWLRSKEFAQAADTLHGAFTWMAEQQIDYLPHWWHPSTMVMLCTYALQQGIRAHVAEQIVLRHLGELASKNLQELLNTSDPQVQRRAKDVFEILYSESHTVLDHVIDPAVNIDPTVNNVVNELLRTRRLLSQKLVSLVFKLMAEDQYDKPNLTLVAVFGLYVDGASRKQIAEKLHLSPSSVRNYINHIFKVFELPYDPAKRYERYLQLRSLALAAGYIGEESTEP